MDGLLSQFSRTRDLYPGEDEYFKKNKNVGGMATEDNYIILNPYTNLNPEQQNAVKVNEAARLYMNQYGTPNISLTKEQKDNFQGLGDYATANPEIQKQTIIGRILSGDNTAGTPTMAQLEAIKPMLFLKGLLSR
jgi:hypothetical protein